MATTQTPQNPRGMPPRQATPPQPAKKRPQSRILQEKKKPRKYKKGVTFLGVLFVALAVTGVVAIVMTSLNLIRSLSDDSDLKEQFEELLAPVVMFDPLPFDSLEEAPPTVLIQTSLWSILRTADISRFQQDEYERMMVPQSDIDVECARIFGITEPIEHQSFTDLDMEYEYNSVLGVYYVPIFGQLGYYMPRVDEIKRWGNEYTLTVSYYTAAPVWGGTSDAEKVMYYTIQKERDQYYIKAIKEDSQARAGYRADV